MSPRGILYILAAFALAAGLLMLSVPTAPPLTSQTSETILDGCVRMGAPVPVLCAAMIRSGRVVAFLQPVP